MTDFARPEWPRGRGAGTAGSKTGMAVRDLMRLVVALVAILVVTAPSVLSGCVEEPERQSDDTTDTMVSNNTTVAPEVFPGSGTIAASAGALSTGTPGTPFQVNEGAMVIFVEIAWDDPVNDIDLILASPSSGSTGTARNFDHSADGGLPGQPDSPHSLTLTGDDIEAGEWLMSAQSNGAGAQVDYTVVATVFYAESSVPDGYTALG